MGGQIQAKGTHEFVDVTYAGLEDIKGIFIRAAIRYLSELSSQNLSNQFLVNEGILPPGSIQASLNDEIIVVTNYRSRIEEATRLLNSWVREVRPGEGSLTYPSRIDRLQRPAGYTAGFEMPIADSILPPGVTPAMLAIMGDLGTNYRIDRIPKTMTPVLSQLKLEGLHHYVAHHGELSYQQSMEVVDFMDKVVREADFPEDLWYVGFGQQQHFLNEMKAVIRACLADNVVTID
jgi:hypothetical protein